MRYLSMLFLFIFSQFPLFSQNDAIILQFESIQQLSNKGQFKEALAAAQATQQLILKQSGKTDSLYFKILPILGNLYLQLADYPASEAILTELKTLQVQKFGKGKEYAETLGSIAYLYLNSGKGEEAARFLKESLPILEKTVGKNHPNYANAVGNMAQLYWQQGDLRAAETYILITKEIQEKNLPLNEIEYANTINNLGLLYSKMGRQSEAEPLYKQLLEIDKRTLGEAHPDYAVSLNNLGLLYIEMARYMEAEPYLLQSVEIRAKALGKSHPAYSTALNNLAKVYVETNRTEESEKMLKEIVTIREKSLGKEHPLYLDALNRAGNFYITNKNYAAASPYYIEAIAGWEKILAEKRHIDYARALSNYACLLMFTQRADSAMIFIMKSFAANSYTLPATTGFSDDFITQIAEVDFMAKTQAFNSINALAQLFQLQYAATQDKLYLDRQFTLCKAITAFNNKIRNEFSSERDKLNVLKENTPYAFKAVRLAAQLSKSQNDTYIETAFQFTEENKSILLADALKSQAAYRFGNLPDSLSKQEAALQQALSKLKKQIIEAKTPEEKTSLNTKLTGLNSDINRLKKQLEQAYPEYFKYKYQAQTTKIAQIQQLLDDKTAFIEYLAADTISFAFLITKNKAELIELKHGNVKEIFQAFRKSISDYDYIQNNASKANETYTVSALGLYKKFIAPFEEKLSNINHLIIVPDNYLGHIPFEALLTEKPKEITAYHKMAYLINRYKVSYSYSALLWLENSSKQYAEGNSLEMLAAAASYAPNSGSIATEQYSRSARTSSLRKILTEIPATKTEVQYLQRYFKGLFWYDAVSNEKNFKQEAPKYDIIHLAMHGLLDEKNPILSSLAFTEDGDSIEDNFLEAWEISHLKLKAQLVVLSACETGYGKFEQGEGVMSLARSFMYAGVPSLVVSMWQVNDQSTSLIMQSFYKNLAKGMDKAEALRQAKLAYIGSVDDTAAHPAFWAAFVQLGDSRAIRVAQIHEFGLHGWGWWIGGGLAAVAAVGGGAMAMRRRRKK